MGIFQIAKARIVASSAIEAITSHFARSAPLGAEMLDASSKVLARKVRVLVEGIPLEAWQPTDAWPETLALGGTVQADRPMLASEASREGDRGAPPAPESGVELFPGIPQMSPASDQDRSATP